MLVLNWDSITVFVLVLLLALLAVYCYVLYRLTTHYRSI